MAIRGDRRDFLRWAGAGAAGLALSGLPGARPADAAGRGRRPNIVLIMADDLGYSDLGCYGGEIQTPNLDALAANGLRFTQFYNAARCCPTRASLLTGVYPHQAGIGNMITHGGQATMPDDLDTGPYQGYLKDRCVTIAEALKPAGYRTYMTGKWHVGEFAPYWPNDRGFDRYYGLISGVMNYFGDRDRGRSPDVDRTFVVDGELAWPDEPGFYATDAFTDRAIDMLDEHPEEDPFLLYIGHIAPHWPLHAWEEDIFRYEGGYMSGWSELRRRRYAKQKQLGLMERDWELSPQDPEAADWDELDHEKRIEMDRKMAVHAAMTDAMDRSIGRLVDKLKAMGCFEDTLILFLSDNGASHERGPFGRDFRPDLTGPIGSVNSYHSYGRSWSNASNTPFRLHKHWIHEGGSATPLIAHWPNGIEARGEFRDQVGHVIDFLPTFLELAGAEYPSEIRGLETPPVEGRSLVPFFNSDRTEEREIYWEHRGNRALRCGDWKLVADGEEGPWELYNMAEDRTEVNDLIDKDPDRAREMMARWEDWARRIGVEWVE